MNENIIRIREELVGLSSDPIKTRELLDKLTEEEIFQHDIESTVHIGKNDLQEEKDFDFFKVCKTNNGYLVHYKGGYTVIVDDKLLSTCGAIELLTSEEKNEETELAKTAVETIFRLPMFVFSHPATTYNIATIATQYMLYLQKTGEVPTEETENPEYDKFILQMNEMLENFATGLEKEGIEYEKRNGIENGTEERKQGTVESESKGEGEDGEAEAQHP